MDLSKKKQEQAAGDNAVQNQIGGQGNVNVTQVINYYGVQPSDDVNQAASVYYQMQIQAAKEYTDEAFTTTNERIESLGRELFPRIIKMEGQMEVFRDPKFQFLLRDAQVTAAKTDRVEDLSLLSELLCCHITKGDDRKIDAGIHHAIRIVDEIDNDALCALTVVCAFQFYAPISDTISSALKILNNLFKNMIYMKLPEGVNWMDHLDMLGALRLSSLNKVDSKRYLCQRFNVCVGIRKGSDELDSAYAILDENNIPRSYLIDNECMDGYLVFKGSLVDDVDEYLKDKSSVKERILDLYCKDQNILNSSKEKFIELWDSHPYLKEVRLWWNNIPYAYSVSYMGRALAQTNAKRIDSNLPDLI